MYEEDKEVKGLSTTAKYTLIAILLGILTVVEVLVLYPPLLLAPLAVKIGVLGVLGTGKFLLVVAFFMHLWDDHPIYTGIFTIGMIIGGGTLVAMVALFDYYPTLPNAKVHPPLEEIFEERRRALNEGADREEHSRLPEGIESVSFPAA